MVSTVREQGLKVRRIFETSREHDTHLPGRPSALAHLPNDFGQNILTEDIEDIPLLVPSSGRIGPLTCLV